MRHREAPRSRHSVLERNGELTVLLEWKEEEQQWWRRSVQGLTLFTDGSRRGRLRASRFGREAYDAGVRGHRQGHDLHGPGRAPPPPGESRYAIRAR